MSQTKAQLIDNLVQPITGALGSAAAPTFSFTTDPNTGLFSPGADAIALATAGTNRLHITSAGNVGIGTTSPSQLFHCTANAIIGGSPAGQWSTLTVSGDAALQAASPTLNFVNAAGSARFGYLLHGGTGGDLYLLNQENGALRLGAGNAERARIDSSGRLLVGTSTARVAGQDLSPFAANAGDITLERADIVGLNIISNRTDFIGAALRFGKSTGNSVGSNAIVASGNRLGMIQFCGADGTDMVSVGAQIEAVVDGTPGVDDMPGRLVFSTTTDGASSPTERMRISSTGGIYFFGKTTDDITAVGVSFSGAYKGNGTFVTDGIPCLTVNRKTSDGTLQEFYQDASLEGTISVSGSTVSYNGAHLSRWSQLPDGAEREEILRGTVLSNIDEMCSWGKEDNEQLNRMQVSNVEGDSNVSGVFQAWDDDDDTYTDDFYCAMTGDFIIRIAEGTPVHRGQLLMSAGDGTAKPQGDGFVQDKTIAKVTSNHVTCTYDDGSYCVPCVLMAC